VKKGRASDDQENRPSREERLAAGSSGSRRKVVESEFRVRYGDTDKMGVAYYARYLEWFEVGRTEFFRKLGVTYAGLERRSFFLPVVEVHCRYRTSTHYDDLLTIRTSVVQLGRASITFAYEIVRDGDPDPVAEGRTAHGCVDKEGKIVRLPEDVAAALQAWQDS
jgi:acyl-CoA thioester hydrolase